MPLTRLPRRRTAAFPPRLIRFACILAGFAAALPPATASLVMRVNSSNQVAPVTDDKGFVWQFDGDSGSAQSGSSAFRYAMNIEDGQGHDFDPGNPEEEEGGIRLQGEFGKAKLTRRVRVDKKRAVARWFDTFTNPTDEAIEIQIQYRLRRNNSAQAVISNREREIDDKLEPDETALALIPQSSRDPAVLLAFRDDRSDITPRIQNQRNYRITLTYKLALDPGQRLTLMHALAQRNLKSDRSGMVEIFETLQSTRPLRHLPRQVRRSLANWRVGVLVGQVPELWPMEAALGASPGPTAQFIAGDKARLKGRMSWDRLRLHTRFGPIEPAPDEVAGIAGPRAPGLDRPRLYLDDGHVLLGRLEAENFRFVLSGETAIAIEDPGTLDRIIAREEARAVEAPALLVTRSGERLALTTARPLAFTAATAWGERALSWKTLRFLARNHSEEAPGHALYLTDGSALLGTLEGRDVELETVRFGTQTFDAEAIEAIILPGRFEEAEAPIEGPHARVSGDQVLPGRLDQEVFELVAGGIRIPFDPGQIHELVRVADDPESPAPFEVRTFDGSTGRGRIAGRMLSFSTGEVSWQVPLATFESYVAPAPELTDATRTRLRHLIADLADEVWQTREAASAELASMGRAALPMLREALKQSRDAEVRERVRDLLERIR